MSARKADSGSAPPVRFRHIFWGLLVLVCVLVIGGVVLAQGGSIYTLRRSVLSGGGARVEGNRYVINYSFGQPSTIGNSSGTTYGLRQGYWRAIRTPTPTPTPLPTCAPIDCLWQRVYGYQPHRFETVRPIFNAAAGNSLVDAAPTYDPIDYGPTPTPVAVSPDRPIPHVILRGMYWEESKWKQFADDETSDPDGAWFCTLKEWGGCGCGLVQMTSCMDTGCGWFEPARVAGELAYNLGTGTNWLINKWNGRDHFIIGNRDHTEAEDWYYAVTAYNGWSNCNHPNRSYRNDYCPEGKKEGYIRTRAPWGEGDGPRWPYQETAWGWMAHPGDVTAMDGETHRLWRPTRVAWVPRGIWGSPSDPELWEPQPYTTKPVFSLLRDIKVVNGESPAVIVLRNTRSDLTLAADIALYNDDHTFNRWWLGGPPPDPPLYYIQLPPAEPPLELPVAQVFKADENFSGYARVSANEGVEVSLRLQPPPPPPYPNVLVLPVVFKNYPLYGANCHDIIENGGFETFQWGRPAGWIVSSDDGYPLADGTWFYEGHYGAYLGGYDDLAGHGDVDDSLKQGITIPADARAADLVFWWYMESEEGTTTPTDWFYVRLRTEDGSLVAEWSKTNLDSRSVWQEESISLLNYRGQGLYLAFETDNDNERPTRWFVDKVRLWVCEP